MAFCDDVLNDDNSFSTEEIIRKKKKKKKDVEIFYENESDLYSPCIDIEGALCVISDGGDIFRYKLIKIKGDEESNDNVTTSSSEGDEAGSVDKDVDDDEYISSVDKDELVGNVKKKKDSEKGQEEKYLSTDFTTECLCADNAYNFYVFDPITRGLMVIDRDKKMELYTEEYEDEPFKRITNLVYDRGENVLYVVDAGNLSEENKCNLYYINKDIETMVSMDMQNMPYVSSICIYRKDNIHVIYACLTKENRIVRLIKRGNTYIKTDFLYLSGNYSPVFICTDNMNFVILLKDLTGSEPKGKILEINSKAEVINTIFINGNHFNGICYDYNMGKYFFVEKNVIYTY
ncbi:conserved Plasmodium protein, unknown function [Plasmodium ovale]|uniref:Uncharacterized protein n=2 Tax=Plasmodium ovale TaxID=36330 RepID=A0A1D3U994_PLAOA|nr:conserved Plasmodium protein, unknown function [Plasmodium ovale]